MLPTLGQDVGVHVDHGTAYRPGRSDGQGQVFVALEDRQLLAAHVDDPGVDGVGHREIDELAEKTYIRNSIRFVVIGKGINVCLQQQNSTFVDTSESAKVQNERLIGRSVLKKKVLILPKKDPIPNFVVQVLAVISEG